jgi:NAD kinase
MIGYFKITCRLLNSYRVSVIVEPEHYKEIQPPLRVKSIREMDTKLINAIITVGGDGTILWANRHFKYEGIPPIISFAMGTINYMCCFPVKNYVEVLTKGLNLNRACVQDSTYKLEVKSRLECTVLFNLID